jgi:hypothetical protein
MNAYLVAPIAAALIALGAGSAASASGGDDPSGCDPRITVVGETRINDYDALTGGFYVEPIRLRLTNDGGSACVGHIRFTSADGRTRLLGPGGEEMTFLIVAQNDAGDVLFDPLSLQGDGLRITLPPRRDMMVQPRFYVAGSQRVPSGLYTADVEARFHRQPQGSPHGDAESDPVTIPLAVNVKPVVQANFTGVDSSSAGGTVGGVALGELTPGMRRNLGIQVRANTDVSVSVSSANQGALLRENGSEEIGYTLIVNGNPFTLSSTAETTLAAGLGVGGVTNPVAIQLENYTAAPAGRYGDTVTFRISAQ